MNERMPNVYFTKDCKIQTFECEAEPKKKKSLGFFVSERSVVFFLLICFVKRIKIRFKINVWFKTKNES